MSAVSGDAGDSTDGVDVRSGSSTTSVGDGDVDVKVLPVSAVSGDAGDSTDAVTVRSGSSTTSVGDGDVDVKVLPVSAVSGDAGDSTAGKARQQTSSSSLSELKLTCCEVVLEDFLVSQTSCRTDSNPPTSQASKYIMMW